MGRMTQMWLAVIFLTSCGSALHGCGFVRVNGEPVGGGSDGSGGSSASGTSSAAPDAEATAVAELEAMTDEEVAKWAVRDLLGELHEVEGLSEGTSGWVATGDHRFGGRRGEMSFDIRVERIYDPDDLEAKRALCTEVFRYEHRLEEDAAARCRSTEPWGVPDDPAYRKIEDVVRLEALLNAIPDLAFAQEARQRFLQRFGWEARHYYFVDGGNNPDGGGRTLLEVRLNEWTRRTVQYAVWYAKEHGLGDDLVARLEAAIDDAPSLRCRRAEVYFIKDHLGGGRYGEIEPGRWGTDLPRGEIVDCATLSEVGQEAWGMRVMRDTSYSVVKRWLGIEALGDWSVHRNEIGIPQFQRRRAAVYFEEPI